MFNFFSIGTSDSWDRPHEFRPERFLEEEKALADGFMNADLKPTPESCARDRAATSADRLQRIIIVTARDRSA